MEDPDRLVEKINSFHRIPLEVNKFLLPPVVQLTKGNYDLSLQRFGLIPIPGHDLTSLFNGGLLYAGWLMPVKW